MFFYGYVLTQLPGGRFAELFGGKWLFGGGILVTAVFTLLTPLAALESLNHPGSPPYLLYVVRIIEGLGEGVTFPAMLAMLARWTPPHERSRFTSFAYAGSSLGTVVSMPISGYLCDNYNWQSVFYVFGAIGVIWFVAWSVAVYDGPEVHPWISEEEKSFILSSFIDTDKPDKIPILAIIKSVPVWAIIATHVTQGFGYYVLLTELPTYMKNILHFDMKSDALLSGIPYFAMWLIALIGSNVVDLIITKNVLTTNLVRKLANTIGTMGPALALLGIIYSGEQSAILDIANNFAGTLMGIINALGNTMGFVAPTITGLLTNGHNDMEHWNIVFGIACGVYTFGNVIFVLFGTTKEQSWNRKQTNEDE